MEGTINRSARDRGWSRALADPAVKALAKPQQPEAALTKSSRETKMRFRATLREESTTVDSACQARERPKRVSGG